MTISPTKVTSDDHTQRVAISDGRTLGVPLAWFPLLLHASPAQRGKVELRRTGLQWEDLDEDISIKSQLAGRGAMTKWLDSAA